MNVFKWKKDFNHLRDLHIPPLNPGGLSLLVGTNFPNLLLHRDFRSGECYEPFTVKTLGWVWMGEKGQSKNLNFNFIHTYFDLEQFWNLENYGTLPKTNPNLFTKDEKRAVNILENIREFIKGKYQVGLLWKKDNPILPYKRNLALKRLENLEKKFSKNQLLVKRYSETINSYISKGYATKIESIQNSQRNNITNYILHHGVINNINQIN